MREPSEKGENRVKGQMREAAAYGANTRDGGMMTREGAKGEMRERAMTGNPKGSSDTKAPQSREAPRSKPETTYKPNKATPQR